MWLMAPLALLSSSLLSPRSGPWPSFVCGRQVLETGRRQRWRLSCRPGSQGRQEVIGVLDLRRRQDRPRRRAGIHMQRMIDRVILRRPRIPVRSRGAARDEGQAQQEAERGAIRRSRAPVFRLAALAPALFISWLRSKWFAPNHGDGGCWLPRPGKVPKNVRTSTGPDLARVRPRRALP